MKKTDLHKLLDTIPKNNLHVARACLEILQADSSAARFEARLESAPYDEEMDDDEVLEVLATRRQAHDDDEWVSMDEL
ncbi:MAG: hypothetical protein WC314_25070 [Vulcanimicrobiota bacterium]